MKMPAYYEIRLPDGTTAFRHLDAVLEDAVLRGEVIASLLKQAEVHELKSAELRDVARALVAQAAGPSGGTG
jgi:hypothetical protein